MVSEFDAIAARATAAPSALVNFAPKELRGGTPAIFFEPT
jgi:hypothetical protein